VHFDPKEAASVGLRAPVAQGLMSLTWMMEAVAKGGVAKAINIAADFRSPIFWDDSVDVFAKGDTDVLVTKADGSVCSLGRISDLVR
jgi:acyl dehydratase